MPAAASARSRSLRRSAGVVCGAVLLAASVSGLAAVAGPVSAARADTAPTAPTVPTVSADALPTVQINGVVYAQVTVGNTVYATGSFSSARPAGSPLGTNETPRANLLAYDITTGALITSFSHSLDQQGLSIAASPDGSRVYVGGHFTTVDGIAHRHIAAFSTATGALVSTFAAGLNGDVQTLAASDTAVYAGGAFASASGSVTRSHLAAFATTGALLPWAPATNASVTAMVITPDGSKVVFGGPFSTVNGSTYHSIGAADAVTGTPAPWASQSDSFPIRNDQDGSSATISSLSTDGTALFLTAWDFGLKTRSGGFEGRASISAADGHLIWLNNCHGDTYDGIPLGGVLYSVGHAHGCSDIGGFPEVQPLDSHHHYALAEATTPSGGVNTGPSDGYSSFAGQPDTAQLDWYPTLTIGSYTKKYQAGWSVTGNSTYLALGGEFPEVNGVAQQGLVRFAISSAAPDRSGPVPYPTSFPVTASTADASGSSTVSWPTTWDMDNQNLTYSVTRDGGTTPVYTTTTPSTFWTLPTDSFQDTGLVPGSTHSYQLTVTDPFKNTITGLYNEVDDTGSAVTYAGSWSASTGTAADYAGTVHKTSRAGDTATLRFVGKVVSVVADRAGGDGTIGVSVDGGAATTVNLATVLGSTTVPKRVYSVGGLANTPHVITVTNQSSGNVVLDGFLVVDLTKDVRLPDGTVRHPGSTLPVDDSAPGVTYQGGWATNTQDTLGNLDSDVHYTNDTGATVTFQFVGTGADLLAPTWSFLSQGKVSVDGVVVGSANENSGSSYVGQQVVYSVRGLTAGAHTLTFGSAAGGTIFVDGLTVVA